ncbi:MAG: hypothetical protein M0Z62_11140 [Actinomycetota bacterium]|nr:hypothetical protein [Actinomycetota bacterium]
MAPLMVDTGVHPGCSVVVVVVGGTVVVGAEDVAGGSELEGAADVDPGPAQPATSNNVHRASPAARAPGCTRWVTAPWCPSNLNMG